MLCDCLIIYADIVVYFDVFFWIFDIFVRGIIESEPSMLRIDLIHSFREKGTKLGQLILLQGNSFHGNILFFVFIEPNVNNTSLLII